MKLSVLIIILLSLFQSQIYSQKDYILEEPPDEPYATFDIKNKIDIFNNNNKKGLKSLTNDSILLDAKYDEIEKSYEYYIIRKSGNWSSENGIYDPKQKKLIVPVAYSNLLIHKLDTSNILYNNSKYFFEFRKNAKKGIIDNNMNLILDFIYDDIQINKGFIKVNLNNKYGIKFLAQKNNDIPIIYKWISIENEFQDIICENTDSIRLFDFNGNLLLKDFKQLVQYRSNWQTGNKRYYLIQDKNYKYGIYNGEINQFLLKPKYDKIIESLYKQFIIKNKLKFGVVIENNEMIIPIKYDSLKFANPATCYGVVAFLKGKAGLIDFKGKTQIDFKYDDIQCISKFYKANIKDKVYVIDQNGIKLTQESFEHVGNFYYGKCSVIKNNKLGYINEKGELIEPFDKDFKGRGFKSLTSLYKTFVSVLKLKNDSLLKEFCYDVTFDGYTAEFMNRIGYEYRGIPNSLFKRNGFSKEKLIDDYFDCLKKLQNNLDRQMLLENLEFIGFNQSPFGLFSDKNIEGCEVIGLFESSKNNFKYKLGEFMYIEGYWKSFTNPH